MLLNLTCIFSIKFIPKLIEYIYRYLQSKSLIILSVTNKICEMGFKSCCIDSHRQLSYYYFYRMCCITIAINIQRKVCVINTTVI